jgi:hypothetical protein
MAGRVGQFGQFIARMFTTAARQAPQAASRTFAAGRTVARTTLREGARGGREGVRNAAREAVRDLVWNPETRTSILNALLRQGQVTLTLQAAEGGEGDTIYLVNGDPGLADPGRDFPTACSCKIRPVSLSAQGPEYRLLDCSFCGTRGQGHRDLKRAVEASLIGTTAAGPEQVREAYLAFRRGQTMRGPGRRASPVNYRALAGLRALPPLPRSPSRSRRSRSRSSRSGRGRGSRRIRSASARLRRTRSRV